MMSSRLSYETVCMQMPYLLAQYIVIRPTHKDTGFKNCGTFVETLMFHVAILRHRKHTQKP